MSWPPSVDDARPRVCPCCALGAWADGLRIVGHGLVSRQQRGPATPDGPPTCVEVLLRRYRCKACGAVLCVGPPQVVPRKHFSGCAIAMALALWGLARDSARTVRRRVSDWQVVGPASRGWDSLRRWTADVAAGRLFGTLDLRALPSQPRDIASRAAQALCGLAHPHERSAVAAHQAFAGARHVS